MTAGEINQLADLIRATPAAAPRDAERDGAAMAAALASPMRVAAGQSDAGHLPLFVAANEPPLI